MLFLFRKSSECRNLLVSLSNKNVKFRFVKRVANNVAHYLMRYSSFMVVVGEWEMSIRISLCTYERFRK